MSQVKRDWIFDPNRKHLLNITKMTLHVPDKIWEPHAHLARATVRDAVLEKVYREMIIVRVGYLEKSEYELCHHRSIAANIGIPAEQPRRAGERGRLDPSGEGAGLDRFHDRGGAQRVAE